MAERNQEQVQRIEQKTGRSEVERGDRHANPNGNEFHKRNRDRRGYVKKNRDKLAKDQAPESFVHEIGGVVFFAQIGVQDDQKEKRGGLKMGVVFKL